jgi:hypothetical protein
MHLAERTHGGGWHPHAYIYLVRHQTGTSGAPGTLWVWYLPDYFPF